MKDIPYYSGPIPHLTSEQMIEVDRAMIEDFKIQLVQMMENAGRNLAHLARVRFLSGDPRRKKVVVLAGTGGNGGGALVCARRLHNFGAQVHVYLAKSKQAFTSVPDRQLEILGRMGIGLSQIVDLDSADFPDLIVDGVIGYSLKGAPRGNAARLIQWANNQRTHILALDVPSGIDATNGTVFDPAIRATATMTLALPKKGLLTKEVEAYVGELYLADISVPPSLYANPPLELTVPSLFAENDIIQIR